MPGLTPRSIQELFDITGSMKQFNVQMSCYMVEIYKGELRDLLVSKQVKDKPKLDIKLSQDNQVTIKNVEIK